LLGNKVTSNRRERFAGTQDGYLPALDGLRFLAAMLVAGGHYSGMFSPGIFPEALRTFTGLGMTLFFVLSGFVIHYNYHATIQKPTGVRLFMAARFARLYPLYIILFLLEFASLFVTARSACARIGEPVTQFYGLLNYLTFTQSWFYTIICDRALIYQYGPISAVSWSISVELFFYLAYVVIGKLIGRRQPAPATIIGCTAVIYLLTVIYFWLCGTYQTNIDNIGLSLFGPAASSANGYNDSLLRWLLYFNPIARLAEFIAGMAVAMIYLRRRSDIAGKASGLASLMALSAIIAVVAVHLWLYEVVAPNSAFIGRTASPLYGPLVAIMMYCVAQYATPWSQLLSSQVMVALGQASYSIYLLHELFPSILRRLGIEAANPVAAWALWTATLVALVIVSRVSFLMFETPARLAVRKLLAPQVPRRS
jgi:peptidoglycan/LPS O-acetylase OafA/YrhL